MTHQNFQTTLIKIDKREKDAVAKVCALLDQHVGFYTIEQNEELLMVEIYTNNSAITYFIGRLVRIEMEEMQKVTPDLFTQLATVTKP